MAVKIRLQRKGRKKAPFYYLVVADSRSPRDGRFVERIGSYNPVTRPAEIDVEIERALYWLDQGATTTKTVRDILSKYGVMYRKHLLRGVKMGVLTQEDADAKFDQFIKEKAEKLQSEITRFSEKSNRDWKKRQDAEAKVNENRIAKIQQKRKAEIQDLSKGTEEPVESQADDTEESQDNQE